MKAQDKSLNYKVYDCQYCLCLQGKKTGCIYPTDCCCPMLQKKKAVHVSECKGCPYGRDFPCIGWCTKEVMRAIGLIKERDRPNV